jgi:hypothetical protein
MSGAKADSEGAGNFMLLRENDNSLPLLASRHTGVMNSGPPAISSMMAIT